MSAHDFALVLVFDRIQGRERCGEDGDSPQRGLQHCTCSPRLVLHLGENATMQRKALH